MFLATAAAANNAAHGNAPRRTKPNTCDTYQRSARNRPRAGKMLSRYCSKRSPETLGKDSAFRKVRSTASAQTGGLVLMRALSAAMRGRATGVQLSYARHLGLARPRIPGGSSGVAVPRESAFPSPAVTLLGPWFRAYRGWPEQLPEQSRVSNAFRLLAGLLGHRRRQPAE